MDYIACYVVPLDKSILLPIQEIGKRKTITVRITPTENGQQKGIHYIEDYSFDKIILNSCIKISLQDENI